MKIEWKVYFVFTIGYHEFLNVNLFFYLNSTSLDDGSWFKIYQNHDKMFED